MARIGITKYLIIFVLFFNCLMIYTYKYSLFKYSINL